MSASRRILYLVICPYCGKATAKTLRWLAVYNNMTCPKCSRVVNLEGADIATVIEELSEARARIDAALTKRHDLGK